MIKEAIILAGGLGTRLKGVIADIPKPMAPINNIPFLKYLFDYLLEYKVTRVILSVGYKHEVIKDYFGSNYNNLELVYAVENEPLGTGGGIANALTYAKEKELILLNGDTFFKVNLNELYKFHSTKKSELTLSLKYLQNIDRYGTVVIEDSKVCKFVEKIPLKEGLINGGVYILNKNIFNPFSNKKIFSFEKDIMENGIKKTKIFAFESKGYFIDIGIPEDYKKAQTELPRHI